MSSVTYRYEQNYTFLKKGVKNTIKESVIDGQKGLSILYLKKVGEDSFYRFNAVEIEKGKFTIKEKENDTEKEPTEMNEKELMKKLKQLELTAIIDYISKERGTYKGLSVTKMPLKISGYEDLTGGKKSTTKASKKKVTKKGSKKGTK